MNARNAQIIETPNANNGYRWVFKVEGDPNPVYLSGIGSPKKGKVGDRGDLIYSSSSSRGGYVWVGPF
jgi:hypothetical protein